MITTTNHGRFVDIELFGEFDLATAPELERAVDAVLNSDRRVPIMVDCAGVSFMDSAGGSPLTIAEETTRDRRQDLWIRNASPRIQLVLRCLGLGASLDNGSLPLIHETGQDGSGLATAAPAGGVAIDVLVALRRRQEVLRCRRW